VSSPEFAPGEEKHIREWFGRPVDVVGYFLAPEEVSGGLAGAGFEPVARLLREPNPALDYPSRRCYLLARRTGPR
jgi:hypothetical protein